MSRKLRLQARVDRYLTRLDGAGNQLHSLYIIEAASTVAQDANGLPIFATGETATLVSPAPMVRLGAKLVPNPGGAPSFLGDAWVSHMSSDLWPRARLLAAQGFRIDGAGGDLYRLVSGSLKEVGPATVTFVLERQTQPRP